MDRVQNSLARWLIEALGEETLRNPQDRALRVLEEAIELAQAVGITESKAREQVAHTYSRPPGDPLQEIAGVMNAGFMAAESFRESAHRLCMKELGRAWMHIDLIREKNKTKVQA